MWEWSFLNPGIWYLRKTPSQNNLCFKWVFIFQFNSRILARYRTRFSKVFKSQHFMELKVNAASNYGLREFLDFASLREIPFDQICVKIPLNRPFQRFLAILDAKFTVSSRLQFLMK